MEAKHVGTLSMALTLLLTGAVLFLLLGAVLIIAPDGNKLIGIIILSIDIPILLSAGVIEYVLRKADPNWPDYENLMYLDPSEADRPEVQALLREMASRSTLTLKQSPPQPKRR